MTESIAPAANGTLPVDEVPAGLAPLVVAGLVVTTADLVRALRVYVPQLADISPLDGERFLLHLPAVGGGGAES